MRTFYHYDRANRLQKTVTNNQVTTYTSDAAGNCTGVTSPTSSTTYHWDVVGRLRSVDLDAGTVTYTYDADGRRTTKQGTDGSAVGFLYDRKKVVAETDEPGGPVAALYATTADAEYGDLLGEDGGYSHAFDAQSDTAALTDASGAVQAAYKYYAFGHVSAFAVDGDGWQSVTPEQWATGDTAVWSDLPPELNSRMLAGGKKLYYLDAETNLHLLGSGNNGRYYDAVAGRFTSEDPIRQASGDDNLFRYVENSPVDQLDPSGHDAKSDEEKRRQEEEERKRRDDAARKAAAEAAENNKKREQQQQQRQDKPLSANEMKLASIRERRAKFESAKDAANKKGDKKAEAALYKEVEFQKKFEHLTDLEQRMEVDRTQNGQNGQGGQSEAYFKAEIKKVRDEIKEMYGTRDPSLGEYMKAYATGAAEGAQGGLSIAVNGMTHGLSDRLGATESDKYVGSDYDISRTSVSVASTALETATGLKGATQAASGLAKVANFASKFQKAVDAGNTALDTAEGAKAIVNDPTNVEAWKQTAVGAASLYASAKGPAKPKDAPVAAAHSPQAGKAAKATKAEVTPATASDIVPPKAATVEATKPSAVKPAKPAAGVAESQSQMQSPKSSPAESASPILAEPSASRSASSDQPQAKSRNKPDSSVAAASEKVQQKRGPKTNPDAPHNAKIRSTADNLEADGNQIISGGGRSKETLIPTPGGIKEGRRPDIIYKTPSGDIKAVNVGRTKADGSPVRREVDAQKDLSGPGNLPTDFVPYDR